MADDDRRRPWRRPEFYLGYALGAVSSSLAFLVIHFIAMAIVKAMRGR